jgi:hypothetical protein
LEVVVVVPEETTLLLLRKHVQTHRIRAFLPIKA